MLQYLDTRTVHFSHLNNRIEIHGKDHRPAIDMRVSLKGTNRELDALHPDLREALFCNRTKPAEGELPIKVDDMPNMRVPKLKFPIKLDHEQTGMTLEIVYGSGGKSNIVLGLVRVHKVEISGIAEGGAVELEFSLSTSNEINERIAGKLAMLQGHDLSIMLTSPEVEDKQTQPSPIDSFLDPEKVAAQQQTPERALADSVGAQG